MMGWLGVRKQDWLSWPADVFDRDLLAFRQEKTNNPLVLPWRTVPALVNRVEAHGPGAGTMVSRQRRSFTTALAGRGRTPTHSATSSMNCAIGSTKQHPHFETRYYVGADPKDPLRLPTKKLTMRTMRHTCITLNHDAGVPRELIRAITGHELDTIDQVLKCYAAVTADQAAAALNIRLAYEAAGRSA